MWMVCPVRRWSTINRSTPDEESRMMPRLRSSCLHCICCITTTVVVIIYVQLRYYFVVSIAGGHALVLLLFYFIILSQRCFCRRRSATLRCTGVDTAVRVPRSMLYDGRWMTAPFISPSRCNRRETAFTVSSDATRYTLMILH